MFKLQKSPTFTTTATIAVPTDDGLVNQTMTVRFRLLDDESQKLDVVPWLREAILSISDIADDDGNQLAFGSEVLDKILSLPFARVGLVRAYWQAMVGVNVQMTEVGTVAAGSRMM